MKLVALKKLRYPRGVEGKEYNPGDEFTSLSERDTQALTLIRVAKLAEQKQAETKKPAARRAPVVTEEMTAEPPVAPTPMTTADVPTAGPKQYLRRDVVTKE